MEPHRKKACRKMYYSSREGWLKFWKHYCATTVIRIRGKPSSILSPSSARELHLSKTLGKGSGMPSRCSVKASTTTGAEVSGELGERQDANSSRWREVPSTRTGS